jgi:hypothetical protein
MRLTDKEKLELCMMRFAFNHAQENAQHAIGEFSQGVSDLLKLGDPAHLYRSLSAVEQVKKAFKAMHNFCHSIGMLAAKGFLEREFPELPWEGIEFTEHANRSGADLRLPEFKIVAELKTTEPCGKSGSVKRETQFGAQQRVTIEKDLQKLSAPQNEGFSQYMFVTSALAYYCLFRDYRTKFPTVCFVQLNDQPKISRPVVIQTTQLSGKA